MDNILVQLTLADERQRILEEKQRKCRHRFKWVTAAYLECSDETVEVAFCPKCGFIDE